jgi:hypothetical protein
MSNKGRYFTREIDLDSIVRNPLRSNLNANGKTITNLGEPEDLNSVARIKDISGGGGANVWYLYPAFTDISLNCNGIQDVSSITFCGRQTYLRQTNTTFDISSNRSIKFNNNQLFLQNNGNVGINKSNPQYTLDVSDTFKSSRIIDESSSSGGLDYILTATNTGYLWKDPDDINVGSATISLDNRWTAINDDIYNNNTGNIGIGISNPQYTLDINGDINVGNSLFTVNNTTGSIILGTNTVNYGNSAGLTNQGLYAIAIGYQAGQGFSGAATGQGNNAIAIGYQAGQGLAGASQPSGQGINAIAMGYQSGNKFQGINSVSIGNSAGFESQGQYAVAIGYQAGYISQSPYSIVLNATGIPVQGDTSGTYIAPIRNIANDKALYYNTSTKEITYSDISNGGSNQWTTSGSNIYNTNYLTGNVAIGKTTPSYSLDVSGSFKSSRIIDVSNSSGLTGETMISLGNGNGYKWMSPVYGSFTSDISQNITADPSNIPITYNRTEIANLCDYSDAKIYVRRSGVFKFLYSIQYTHTISQDVFVDTYIRINGINVPRSTSRILLKKDGFIFPACEYIVPMNKDDYIEVIAYTTDGTVYVFATEEGLNPSIPSIISNIYSLVTYP